MTITRQLCVMAFLALGLAACDYPPKAQFYEGQIVRTKIGHLRGTIIEIFCGETKRVGCRYWARFPVASMSVVEVKPYEIEPAQ